MSSDRRRHTRETVRIEATVVGGNGLLRLPAEIVDRTIAGVRIKLADNDKIDADSYLLFGHRMEPFRVVWKGEETAGLAFIA